ncbi:hypothetical protein EYR36_009532 [Pleurotus pulmonarius]|nr:hypothetical protein EYR36_009532 [Pleurotus pulmonarius]
MTYEAMSHGLKMHPYTGKWELPKPTESLNTAWSILELLPLRRPVYEGNNVTRIPHLGSPRLMQDTQRIHESVFELIRLVEQKAWPTEPPTRETPPNSKCYVPCGVLPNGYSWHDHQRLAAFIEHDPFSNLELAISKIELATKAGDAERVQLEVAVLATNISVICQDTSPLIGAVDVLPRLFGALDFLGNQNNTLHTVILTAFSSLASLVQHPSDRLSLSTLREVTRKVPGAHKYYPLLLRHVEMLQASDDLHDESIAAVAISPSSTILSASSTKVVIRNKTQRRAIDIGNQSAVSFQADGSRPSMSRRSPSISSDGTDSQTTSRYGTPEPMDVVPPGGGIIEHILTSKDFIVSYGGSSQYQSGGVSACGLAALNCVRVILGKERDGIRGEALLREVASRQTAQEITSICGQWAGSAHLEVEEIFRVPLFQQSLESSGTYFERPSIQSFRRLLGHLQNPTVKDISTAVVITRPPEIVACMKIATEHQDVFVIFDSHPRPSHPDGAGFIFNTSLDATAEQLSELMSFDRKLLNDHSMQWQAQLLANFSGLLLKAKKVEQSEERMKQTLVEASLQILNDRGQIAELKTENRELKEMNTALKEENSLFVATNAQLQEEFYALRRELTDAQRRARSREHMSSQSNGNSWFPSIWASSRNPSPPPSSSSSRKDKQKANSNRYIIGPPEPGYRYNTREQSRRNRPPSPIPGSSQWIENKNSSALQGTAKQAKLSPAAKKEEEDLLLAQRLSLELNSADIRDASVAARLQRQFEEEDMRIISEQRDLMQLVQTTFQCQICLEETPEDDLAQVTNCEHSFCRDCLRGHIISRVNDHRYPIMCPSCTVSKDGESSVITDDVVREIGIPEKEYVIWEEMSLASFSILLHCRQCKNSLYVARDEFQDLKVLNCPLPDCHYMWCKQCQQPVTNADGHSCDGSKELEQLMSTRGWKHCPVPNRMPNAHSEGIGLQPYDVLLPRL